MLQVNFESAPPFFRNFLDPPLDELQPFQKHRQKNWQFPPGRKFFAVTPPRRIFYFQAKFLHPPLFSGSISDTTNHKMYFSKTSMLAHIFWHFFLIQPSTPDIELKPNQSHGQVKPSSSRIFAINVTGILSQNKSHGRAKRGRSSRIFAPNLIGAGACLKAKIKHGRAKRGISSRIFSLDFSGNWTQNKPTWPSEARQKLSTFCSKFYQRLKPK